MRLSDCHSGPLCNQEVGGSIPLVSIKAYLIEIYDNQSLRLELPRSTERFIREEGDRMENEITLIDRGRGLQLSTSRITVHDLVPYFRDGCSHDEIIRWIPSLTHEEIAIVERYYRQHQDELDEHERRVQAHRAEQIRLQRLRF